MKLNSRELPYLNSADLFDKVADQPWAVFLDSGVVDTNHNVSKHSDFDVLGIKPSTTLVFDGNVTLYQNGAVEEELHGDPIAILQAAIPTMESIDDPLFAYLPGAFGYFSYDLAREYEDLPDSTEDDENLPSMAMGIYRVIVLVDHRQHKTWILSLGDALDTQATVSEWEGLIEWSVGFDTDNEPEEIADEYGNGRLLSGMLAENMDRALYRKAFAAVRQYTVEGHCYQVNLAKQFSCMVAGDAWLTYRFLRNRSSAPYGAFINFPFAQVLSNSPESFIQCRGGDVVTSPIKGTRPRDHANPDMDRAIANSLFSSEKDRAENLMIVDLMRNDLSKCCELGSVKVPKLFAVHSFANVHHLISTITGRLKQGLHSLDLLRSCFPGGSITGAPKIRAMEIIEELEPNRRGLYCGAIGYVGADGSLETNIAIRTIVVKDGIARYSAGGGLVIDSKVEEEYQEILDKASMMTAALFKRS
ncbi:MAG: para-aminobenzoate synthetase component 1 [Cryomorphaceae bacterium]